MCPPWSLAVEVVTQGPLKLVGLGIDTPRCTFMCVTCKPRQVAGAVPSQSYVVCVCDTRMPRPWAGASCVGEVGRVPTCGLDPYTYGIDSVEWP